MLLEFTVGNFKSFRDKATISLEATSDDTLEDDNVATFDHAKLRLVKAAGIYGPNAGGKSNFLDSMVRFRELILGSSKDSQKGESIPVVPFRLQTDSEEAASFFQAVFLLKGVRYRYGFETTAHAIATEWLFRQDRSSRESCLFTREKSRIMLRRTFSEGNGLQSRTRPNALFLSVAAQFNGRISGEVVSWMNRFRTISGPIQDYLPFSIQLLQDEKYLQGIRELVKLADIGIEGIIRQDVDKEEFLKRLPKNIPEAIRELILKNANNISSVKTTHTKFDSKNQPVGTVEFDLQREESAGTTQLFALAGPLLHTLSEGAVLVADELDAHLHPSLTKNLLGLFNSSVNRNNAQLIFSTHDRGLLDSRSIRRDQIWFVEKNRMGSSSIYSLAELKGVRKDANFEKEYALGQFGGIPRVGDLKKALVNAE